MEELQAAAHQADDDGLDSRRLVIRDSLGRTRILAMTIGDGSPVFALLDEKGDVRAALAASPADNPKGVAMLEFPRKGRPLGDSAALIGAESDGTGTIGIRDSSGLRHEMS